MLDKATAKQLGLMPHAHTCQNSNHALFFVKTLLASLCQGCTCTVDPEKIPDVNCWLPYLMAKDFYHLKQNFSVSIKTYKAGGLTFSV